MNRHSNAKCRLAILAIAVSGVAMADSDYTTSSRTVRIADLNLQSREGAAAVYKRISNTADALCSMSWHARSLGGNTTLAADVRECKMKAIEQSVVHVNAPLLTAIFREKTGLRNPSTQLAQAR